MEKSVPKLRFSGHTDAWKQRKCEEVLIERNIQHPQSDEFPLVSFTVEKGVTPKTERYEREQLVTGDTKSKKYKETRLDDIVYNPANLKFGAIARNKYGNAVFSPIYITYEVNEQIADPSFIEMIVTRDSFIQNALQFQQGTVYERMAVSTDDFAKLDILLPSKKEQIQIGNFFSLFDSLITLQQCKCDETKNFKRCMLQKMYPKEGESVPEVRFPGFTNAWERRKVEEMTVELSEYDNLQSGYPLLTSSRNGLMFQNEFRDKKSTDNVETMFSVVPYGKCTYRHMSDDNIFHFNINTIAEKGLVSREYPVFDASEDSNLKFLIQYLNFSPDFTKFCAQRKLGGTRTRLYYKNLCDYSLYAPSKAEQDEIAQYFEQIDNLITFQQSKLDSLKELKKSLLQQMFI